MLDKTNLVDQIKHDHRELEQYFNNWKSASPEADSGKWFHQFIFEISIHSVAEEQVLYPLMETLGEKGKVLAEKSREDHRKLKQVLVDLSNEKNTIVFDTKMDAMMEDLLSHISSEESDDLVFISDKLSEEQLSKAGKAFSLKKKIVPTRPHPGIPDKPWALEAALGILTAPFDKFADLFRSFPDGDEV